MERDRPIKANFAEEGFNSYLNDLGEVDKRLEIEYAKIEKVVLDQIRRISPSYCGPEQRGAVANLVAVHLVRSRSFRALNDQITEEYRAEVVGELVSDPRLAEIFRAEFGREPQFAELEQLVHDQIDRRIASQQGVIDASIRQHNGIAEHLSRFSVQVIQTDPSGPGFLLGDVPAVHVNTADGRCGFRDRLAVGDANLILAPLTRWTAACFTARSMRHQTLRAKKQLQLINAVIVRAALDEVACHPDDVLEARRIWQHLDRLPFTDLRLG